MRARLGQYLTAAFVTLALATPAEAQQARGFATNRFEPSERGSDWFGNESLDLRGDKRLALGIVGDYGHDPLAIYNPDGSVRTAVVSDQLFAHVGLSYVGWNRVRFGLTLPIALYETGDGGTIDGQRFVAPSGTAIGDLRAGADLRLVGEYHSAFTLAGGLQVWIPTGSRDDYTGDANARLEPRVTAAGDIGEFTYAARVGFQYRGLTDTLAGTELGSEFDYGAAAGLRLLDKKLTIGPEIMGGAITSKGDQIFKARTSPLEGLIGGHYATESGWRFGAGVGAGLSRGLGTPAERVLLVVEYFSPYEKPKPAKAVADRDGDGILDPNDACPDVKGVETDDPKTNGCPEAEQPIALDRDHDGVYDKEDACPDVKGVRTEDAKTNGCPPDRDGDGVLDDVDACPDEPGVKTDDPKTNGCPPDPDRDKDGIPNENDACPDAPGPANADPYKNGCPAAVVKNDQIVILEQVQFATGSAVILPASDTILNAVKKVLDDHPEIKKVSIEGHTDNRGAAAMNETLSKSRAAAVVTWLVKHGIDQSRLTSNGFGPDRPIDSNSTPEGRQANRRVEFHIVKE